MNYRLAGPEDQRSIFESLCDFYNGYDPTIGVQMTLSSRYVEHGPEEDLFGIRPQGDDLDPIREDAAGILRFQYERGSNGYVKTKYVTLTIEAENLAAARARFARIETDTLNRFKVMGAAAHVLDGKERLELLHGILHPEGGRFAFDWDWLAPSGLSVKDFIAPSSFHFGETRTFRIGEMYGAVSFLQITAPEIHDRILAEFMETEGNILVTMHIRGINQNEAIKMVKRKITDLDAMKIAEQKRAVRSGYDMDILPSDLATYGGAAKTILQDLQSRNERMFNLTFLVMHIAATKQKLEIAVSQAASVAQTYNCLLTRLDFQQEDGLMSSLPLGLNRIKIERSLTTSALAVFVPFVTQELFMGGESMYYGLNALSNNMILLDRKQSRCPNGLVFGTPGSGKSMSCKREITFIILTTKDNVIICDPEDEYSPLVKRLGGQVIRLSPSSTDYVNPLDINLNYSDEENPLALKSDFVLSFCELIMGSKTGLEAIEKTVIDRAVQKIYQPYFADPRPENMPILGDLMEALLAQGIPEADRVAQALDLYVNGSLNFFNHRTTVDIRNRLVCFDIKGLGKNLKKPGMLIVQDAVWNTVTINRAIGRSTWYFVDEFHLLLKEEQTAAYSAEIWKRFRKWGGVPTGATQNPKDLLSSPEIENILENSDFIYISALDEKLAALGQTQEDYLPSEIEKFKDATGYEEFLDVDPQAIREAIENPDQSHVDEMLAFAEQANREYEAELYGQQAAPTPDDRETGETVRTPRGTFHVTDMSREQMEAAGYGFHHESEDGKYLIMANGSRAFAIPSGDTPEHTAPEKLTVLVVEPMKEPYAGLTIVSGCGGARQWLITHFSQHRHRTGGSTAHPQQGSVRATTTRAAISQPRAPTPMPSVSTSSRRHSAWRQMT